MTDPILEMTRRDLIRTFVAMGAVFVLPLTATGSRKHDHVGK